MKILDKETAETTPKFQPQSIKVALLFLKYVARSSSVHRFYLKIRISA